MAIDATYPVIGRNPLNRFAVTTVAVVPLLATAFALVWAFVSGHLSWLTIGLFFGMHIIGGLGISLGFHRMLTHGAFKARGPVKALLLWAGLLTIQGGPAAWAATHRRHHARSDKEGDPHSPLQGLFHAHWGWLWKGNLVHSGPGYDDLMKDRMIRFFEKTQLVWYISGFILPASIALVVLFATGAGPAAAFAAAGQALLWAGAVRVATMHHITWSINSICHTWGARPFKSPDVARNNALFGFLGYGEGWHNNHHAFPKSAYLGLRWYQIDLGRYTLVVLRALGLVKDVYVPDRKERVQKSVRPSPRALAAVGLLPGPGQKD